MDHSTSNNIVSFIWSIADDCLRDVYVRGKFDGMESRNRRTRRMI